MKPLHVEICGGTSCRLLGAQDLFDAVEALPLAKREQLELCEVNCLKSCRKGPNVTIDGVLFSEMTPGHFLELIDDNLDQMPVSATEEFYGSELQK